MATVAFSPKALRDLMAIGDYIARDNRVNASRFVDKPVAQCERIGHAPMAYASREELVPGLRAAPIDRYVIYFRVDGTRVRIERVLHGARDLKTLFKQGRLD